MPAEGIFISASIRTLLIILEVVEPGRSSLFAQRVHENVSPTYAEPNAGGSVSSGDRIKDASSDDGYASDAVGLGKPMFGVGEGVGNGC